MAITMETKAKHEMETWCNKKARDRVFTLGDLVLVMLPSSTNKLLAKWMGPYLLRKYYPTPPTKSLFPMQGRITELSMLTCGDIQPDMDVKLSRERKADIKEAVKTYKAARGTAAARTDRATMHVETGKALPSSSPPYRLAHA